MIQTQSGSATLLASISLAVVAAVLILSQSVAVRSATKSTTYATDQNLVQSAAALAVAAGKTYINGLSTPPATCSASSGCATVYSSTALTNGADSQTDTWWTTSGNVHSASCSSLSSAGNVSCAYVVEQASCSTTSGDITYTITGYGYFSGTGSNTLSSRITVARSSASLTRSAFATLTNPAATFLNPTLCPLYQTTSAKYGQSTFSFTQQCTAPTITVNNALTGSTFSSGQTGTITTVGVTMTNLFGLGGCLTTPMVITVTNVTSGASANVSFSPTGSNSLYDACFIPTPVGYQLRYATLSSGLPVSYGDQIYVRLSSASAYNGCPVGSATYLGASTTNAGLPPITSNTTDMNNFIYSLSGTYSLYVCP